MQRTRVALLAPALAAILSVAAILPAGARRPDPPPLPSTPIEIGEIHAGLVARFVTAVEADRVGTYLVAVADAERAEAERVETERVAAAAAAARVPVAAAAPSTGGGHSDAWWHGVAVCEQGGRNDPYFGYFSFMDGSQGGRPWADQVAAGNALLARVSSESPAWAPSCVAAGYAASPGG